MKGDLVSAQHTVFVMFSILEGLWKSPNKNGGIGKEGVEKPEISRTDQNEYAQDGKKCLAFANIQNILQHIQCGWESMGKIFYLDQQTKISIPPCYSYICSMVAAQSVVSYMQIIKSIQC